MKLTPKLLQQLEHDLEHCTTAADLMGKNGVVKNLIKGLTTRDIQEHLAQLYGLAVSPTFISTVTERIRETVIEWQARPLESVYVIVYLDAIYYKIREAGKILSKAAYTCLAINREGHKDLLGIWVDQSEGANFWLAVLTDLKNRGVTDILIACVDGLKGFPEAIQTLFPGAEVQQCIIHQIRNSLRYVATKNQKEFIKDLKTVYQSPTQENAELQLERLADKWGSRYPLVIKSWKNNWTNLATYFKYPEEIRRLIYTTNIVEGLHRQLRKVTTTKTIFPHDDALAKMLFLAYQDIFKKWTLPIRNWAFIVSHLSLRFGERLKLTIQTERLHKIIYSLPEVLNDPYKWKKPRTVFVNSMSDLFHEDIPLEYIQKVFKVMNENLHHTFQVLTKRPERLLIYDKHLHWSENIWMGVTVECKDYIS